MRRATVAAIVGVSVTLLHMSYAWGDRYPETQITVKVVDEASRPVEGAKVRVGYPYSKFTTRGYKDTIIEGTADKKGLFTASHQSIGDVSYRAVKDGYYQSHGQYHFHQHKHGRWEPRNPEVTLVLRKIENPVLMYTRDTKMAGMEVPTVGEPVGFDLIEYDWVAPYGKGKYPDLIFKVDMKFVDEKNFDCRLAITFPNQFDGIQLVKEDRRYGSRLKLARYASESGYEKELVRIIRREPGGPIIENYEDDNNYLFRIRSEEKNGKLMRGMYGKIQGDIEVYPRPNGTARIFFTYFLNPDYTRNLEYGKNLFKDIPERERPSIDQ